jgi:hypothetical protein
MLIIKNINELTGRCIGHWKIHGVLTEPDYYNIKVMHNGSPFDMFNLMVGRYRTSHGDYTIRCYDTQKEHHMPIECMRNRDEFVRFLIDELI